MKKILFVLVLHLLLFGSLSLANDFEITVHSGWSFLNVDQRVPNCFLCRSDSFFGVTTTVDSSPLIGTKAGYYLNDHAEVEGQFAVSPSHRVVSDNSFVCPPDQICPLSAIAFPFFHVEQNMVVYQYGGSFVYNFTHSNVRPFASFGVGGVSSDVDGSTLHDFALQVGGGAKFYFSRLGLRFEVLDQVIPSYALTSKTQHDVQVQYGVVFLLH